LLALSLTALACNSKPAAPLDKLAVVIDGRTFKLELALDDAARHQGLSDRKEIAADGGMLFVFPDVEMREFVMRRCLVPIDIIFLDPAGRVVATHAMKVEPPEKRESEWQLARYSSQWEAQYAIELKGGTLETMKIEAGHRIDLPLDDLKKRAR